MQSARPFVSPDNHSSGTYDIAIVGGGFAGVMTAVHLLRNCRAETSVLLVERSGVLGKGLAFGTKTEGHLLNVPAGKMSAFADAPSHFLEWLMRHKDSELSPSAFVPRQWYGEYIAALLAEQLSTDAAAGLRWAFDEVVTIDHWRDSLHLTLSDSTQYHARFVVLATGNFPPPDPSPMRELSSRYYARYAWAPEALDGLENSDAVLLIGSGLTAVDQVVTLESRGFRGKIYMLSRRGLMPALHAQEPPWPTEWTNDLRTSTRRLVREVRRQVELAARCDIGWRAVIDSLRPATQGIWKSMNLAERKRFLRHIRCFWEVHRHRVPPETGRLLDDLRASGRLTLQAGRVLACAERDGHVDVSYRDRDTGQTASLTVSRIVNCTGHETDARKIDSRLLRSLLDSKLARTDAISLGLDVSDDGAVIDSAGRPSRSLFALGSACKGRLWESTAVPEIRVQAQALAGHLARELAEVPRALSSAV